MRKAWWFAGFAAGVALIIAAVSWVTVTARALERSAAADRRQAFREESARLALWRMDSLLTPLIAREAARPYGAYSAFAPAERAYNRLFAPVKRGDVVLPSPLLGLEQPEVLLHFQVSPRGALSSPQVPVGNQRALAEQGFVDHAGVLRAEARLVQLGALVDRPRLMGALDHLASGLAEATRERSVFMCATLDQNKDGGAVATPGARDQAPVQGAAAQPGAAAPRAPTAVGAAAQVPAAAGAAPAPAAAEPAGGHVADERSRKAGPAETAANPAPAAAPTQPPPAPAAQERAGDDQAGGQRLAASDRAQTAKQSVAVSEPRPDATAPRPDANQQPGTQNQVENGLQVLDAGGALTARSAKEQQARLKNYYNAAGNREAPEDKLGEPGPGPATKPLPWDAAITGAVSATSTAPAAATAPSAPAADRVAAAPLPAAPPAPLPVVQPPGDATSLRAEIMRPLWLGDTLLLARRVTVDGTEHIQGCWLDWPRIRAQLLDGIKDLLPDAQLLPDANEGDDWRHRLATLPVRLEPGDELPDYRDSPRAALTLTLVVAWACVGLAALAGGALLLGALDLSERRGAFVSAVTHELRTPLTTFRLYADLLGGGMVPDERERQRCLDTLRSEADRLAHLVENVLAYARLERAQVVAAEPVVVADLLGTACERLAERARQAGLELVAERADDALRAAVRADPAAIERILFNLVDNAAKYAAPAASDRRLHLAVRCAEGGVVFSVRDHGPGIPGDVARRLFTPFAKSAHEAARSAPGVGLGLALSRRLARQLGGRLAVEPCAEGACFALWLPGV